MAHWRDYIDVDTDIGQNEKIWNPDIQTHSLYENVIRGLNEIWATPEGRDAILGAAENANGKIQIVPGNPDETIYRREADGASVIKIDDQIQDQLRVKDVQGNWGELSLQRMLYHEFQHLWRFPNDPSLGPDVKNNVERPTIHATNLFMQKYYGSTFRDVDAHGDLDGNMINYEGTDWWDFNPNFNPDGYGQDNSFVISDGSSKQNFSYGPDDEVVFDASDVDMAGFGVSSAQVNGDFSANPDALQGDASAHIQQNIGQPSPETAPDYSYTSPETSFGFGPGDRG